MEPRPTSPARDDAADGAVALLAGVGVACTGGLLLGLAGVFSAWIVLTAGAVATVAAWRARPRPIADAGRRPVADVLVVLLVGLAVFLPGYDVSMQAADATVYVGAGAHLARTGALAIADTVRAAVGPAVSAMLFPWQGPALSWVPRARDLAGLMFVGDGPIHSPFSAVSAVWLGLGHAFGGPSGTAAVTPLFGVAGLGAVYLVGRRLLGRALAGLAALLLVVALPQVFFARFALAEVPAQCFLWGALVALGRFAETRSRVAAVAAGLGLACLGLARVEYVAFLVAAAVLAGVLGLAPRLGVPRATTVLAVTGWVAALAIPLVVVPTHYRLAALRLATVVGVPPQAAATLLADPAAAWAAVGVLLVVGVAAGVALPRPWPRALRAIAALGLLAWAGIYAVESSSPARGLSFPMLASMVGWPLVAAGVVGLAVWSWRTLQQEWARLGVLVALVAGFHLLIDLHVNTGILWGSRRVVPVLLPALCLGVATLAGHVARWSRLLAAVAGLAVAASAGWLAWPVWREPFYRGVATQVAAIADATPPDALIVLDGGLRDTLLDVPLWLVNGRETVQLLTLPGDTSLVRPLAGIVPARPVYLLSSAVFPRPAGEWLAFEEVAKPRIELRLPGITAANGMPSTSLVPLRLSRVRLALPESAPVR